MKHFLSSVCHYYTSQLITRTKIVHAVYIHYQQMYMSLQYAVSKRGLIVTQMCHN